MKTVLFKACTVFVLFAASTIPLHSAILPSDSKEPELELDPENMDFGEVSAGGEVRGVFLVSNEGDGKLTIGTVAVQGSDAGHFRIGGDGCSGMKLDPETGCEIEVIFSPFNQGEKSADLVIPSDDPEDEIVFAELSGYGRPGPNLQVSDSISPEEDLALFFGEVTTGNIRRETVTLRNTGNANLSVARIAVSDPLRDPFFLAEDGCSERVLPPNESCLLEIEFYPLTAGNFSDSFDIPTDDPEASSVAIVLSGAGTYLSVPDIDVTDSVPPSDDRQLAFGEIMLDQSAFETVSVTNRGDADLVMGPIAADALQSPFHLATDGCSARALQPGETCTVEIEFSPSDAVPFSETFSIPSNDPDEEAITIFLSGTGTALSVPDIEATDSIAPTGDAKIPFGEITPGNSVEATVTVANLGDADLNIGAIPSLQTPFALISDGCSGKRLKPETICVLDVRFFPATEGSFSDSLGIPSDDPDEGTTTIALTGSAADLPVPDIKANDSVPPAGDHRISFGETLQGRTSRETVTVANEGEADLRIGTVPATSLDAPFSLYADDCTDRILEQGNTCTIEVSFSPVESGAFADSFPIPSDDPDEPSIVISVRGDGVLLPAPDIEIADSIPPSDDLRLPFGSINKGTAKEESVTITNRGEAELRIGSIAPDLSAPFELTEDNCSDAALKPGGNCTFRIGFLPSAPGTFTEALTVPSNDPAEPTLTLTVDGEATLQPVPDIVVLDELEPEDDLRLPFPDLTEGRSVAAGVEIVNRGDADLALGIIGESNPLDPPFELILDDCSGQILAPGESCLIEVSFFPTSTGAFQDSFDLPSDDPDESALTLSVSGRGLSPMVNHAPSSPILLSPKDGAGDLGLTVTFRWKRATDPDGDPVGYRLLCSRSRDFSNNREVEVAGVSGRNLLVAGFGVWAALFAAGWRLRERFKPRGGISALLLIVLAALLLSCGGGGTESDSSEATAKVGDLEPSATYYWKVIAEDERGGRSESEVSRFTTTW